MKREDIIKRMAELGPWTSHNIKIRPDDGDPIYTISPDWRKYNVYLLHRILQIIQDVYGSLDILPKLKILDIGCCEGMYSINLARLGAYVVGIEGRRALFEKANFISKEIDDKSFCYAHMDIRELEASHCEYPDIALCLGVLYLLEPPEAFKLLKKISEITKKVAIFYTHEVKPEQETEIEYEGEMYKGKVSKNYPPGYPVEKQETHHNRGWGAYGCEESFWISEESLIRYLTKHGFTSFYEMKYPKLKLITIDKTFVAIKGEDTFKYIEELYSK